MADTSHAGPSSDVSHEQIAETTGVTTADDKKNRPKGLSLFHF
jgi:hypothetical protein